LEQYLGPKTLAAVYSNFGAVLYESGDLAEGRKLIQKAIHLFESHGSPTNLSRAHCHLAIIALQMGEVALAQAEVTASIRLAAEEDYRRGKQMGKLIEAEIAARSDRATEAQNLVSEALSAFEKLGIMEGLNFEFAGRVHKWIGQLEQAEAYLRSGISVAKGFPLYLAALHVELGDVLRMKGERGWKEEIQRALSLYDGAGCPLRVSAIRNRFSLS
jgi:tetratricopeptide (TPR) repeat protein